MTEDSDLDRATFAQWRGLPSPKPAIPLAMDVAAYIDGRLDTAAAASVEAALAADPALLTLWLDARLPVTPETPTQAVLDRAGALVPGAAVIPFPAVRPGRAIPWVTWGAVAACLVLVSAAGFRIGIEADQAITSAGPSDQSAGDLFDHLTQGDEIG
jgi:anti-sigma factor RsiW